MKKTVLYVHGKGGSAAEAEHYAALLPKFEVIGVDYRSETPWAAEKELHAAADALPQPPSVLIANSIGAYFSMLSYASYSFEQAFFISPIVDMEKLITDMMTWAQVSEERLCAEKEIATAFGETLSWEYLCYVRSHLLNWPVPTHILYAEKDNLTAYDTVARFAQRHRADITVMPDGEHWFHTSRQMQFLDSWLTRHLNAI